MEWAEVPSRRRAKKTRLFEGNELVKQILAGITAKPRSAPQGRPPPLWECSRCFALNGQGRLSSCRRCGAAQRAARSCGPRSSA